MSYEHSNNPHAKEKQIVAPFNTNTSAFGKGLCIFDGFGI